MIKTPYCRACVLGVAVCLLSSPVKAEQPHATLAVINAKVWTVDEERPEASAIAAWRDRILAVGTNGEIRRLIGPETRVVDADGRRVLPGFGDSHVHVLSGGLLLSQVQLKDAANAEVFTGRLKQFAEKLPADRWILGGNWDHDRAFAGKLPTAKILDKCVPDHLVFIDRYDGHMALVNSKTLKLAGITTRTADPPGGVIVRDPDTGEPTGVLRDAAMQLVGRLIPSQSDVETVEAVTAALKEFRRFGITFLDDMGGEGRAARRRMLGLYQRLAQAGKLACRIDFALPLGDAKRWGDLGFKAGFGSPVLRVGNVKGFIDGSLGSSTAKFFAPYVHEPQSTGVFLVNPSRLREQIIDADKQGLRLCIHAIGDEGNARVLDAFAAAIGENASVDHQFRIEHAQHVHPSDFVRFAKLNVVASMQPYHVIDDGRWAESRIGPKRCATSYAYRSMLDAGVVLSFGSDWPVAPLSPLLGIDAAVNRRTLDGKHPDGWFVEQAITVQEAVYAYTMGVALARGQSNQLGSLTPGKRADLVVVSHDILDPAQRDVLNKAHVDITVFAGNVVFERLRKR